MPPQHHQHSPIETASRLTFRRAPSFSSPAGPLTSTSGGGGGGGGGIRGSSTGRGGGGGSSTMSAMATLRGFFSGGGSTAAAAAATHRSRSTSRRPMHVGLGDEEEDEDVEGGGGRGGTGYGDDEGIIPLKMTLGRFNEGGGGRTRMVFTDQGWQVDDDLRRAYERRIHELTEELAEAEHAALASESACKRLEGEKEDQGVLKFKNRLLVEMLAIAQLDEAAAREALGRERTKSEEYRKELERCYARMLGFGIDPGIPSSEPAPTTTRASAGSNSRGGSSGIKSPTKRRV